MKWLIILLILLVLFAIVAMRYRRQIQTAIYMYRMFRKMRQMSKGSGERQIETKQNRTDTPLVRCVGCGNWVAETEVLKMGNKISYCSSACIEKAVR